MKIVLGKKNTKKHNCSKKSKNFFLKNQLQKYYYEKEGGNLPWNTNPPKLIPKQENKLLRKTEIIHKNNSKIHLSSEWNTLLYIFDWCKLILATNNSAVDMGAMFRHLSHNAAQQVEQMISVANGLLWWGHYRSRTKTSDSGVPWCPG